MKRTVVGILAHVDAGKTTLSEAMLYRSGAIDRLGRVDKRDAFLDTHSIERERGITVFSKQACLSLKNTHVTLIDTPGHVDFAPETERALSVQDYAILVISAPDGPSAHTMTLYELLAAKKIPTFIFVNKTDIAERRRRDLLDEIKRAFGAGACDFNLDVEDNARFMENCASADEELMEEFFECGTVSHKRICESIRRRKILPVFFGSALRCEGIDALLYALDRYTLPRRYPENLFGARVYKIGKAPDGSRLTYLKVTGGRICPKDIINIVGKGGQVYTEKVESIRLYSADKYKILKCAEAGTVCAVVGLYHTAAGMGLGFESSTDTALEPVLDYKMIFGDQKTDVYEAYLKLSQLGEEEPSLRLRYDPVTKEIRLRLMGDIQTEVLKKIIKDRFALDISFSEGSILYKETIEEKTYGAGHFEPLMHYAEVRLRLEPLPRGSGLVFTSECPTDYLKTNWQRLILSHLEERAHKGVLTGAPITDIKITLIAGRAHPKHTEGGDFREATFRALRQGLMKSVPILLEPTFDFTIELPQEHLGRAMTDISNMNGICDTPQFSADSAILSGNAPVYTIRSYAKELRSYTHGKGKITLSVGEYVPCHNEDKIVTEIGYSAELDSSVTADSVFCKSGSGYTVAWYEADEKMHTENPEKDATNTDAYDKSVIPERAKSRTAYRGTLEEDKELMRIFESTYGKIKRRSVAERVENSAAQSTERRNVKAKSKCEDYLLIDGYNLIFASDELKRFAESDLSHARDMLIHIICNYNGFKKCNVILVFDAYKRRDNDGSIEECGGITVVYTKERQTADAYIEKCSYDLAQKNSVRVVTSDYTEQLIVLGNGATRVSAREFLDELETVGAQIREIIQK